MNISTNRPQDVFKLEMIRHYLILMHNSIDEFRDFTDFSSSWRTKTAGDGFIF